MKEAPRPLPGWLKWFCLIFGAILILGALYLIVILGLALSFAFHTFLGPKGHTIPQKEWMTIFGIFAGKLVGEVLLLLLGVWLMLKARAKNHIDAASTGALPPLMSARATSAQIPVVFAPLPAS